MAYYWRCEDRIVMAQQLQSSIVIYTNYRNLLIILCMLQMRADPKLLMLCVTALKQRATDNNDKPAQIVQDVLSSSNPTVLPYLPNAASLKQTIKLVGREEYTEPSSLPYLDIPLEFMKTLVGDNFLTLETRNFFSLPQQRMSGNSARLNFGLWMERLKLFQLSSHNCIQSMHQLVPKIEAEFFCLHTV